MFHVVSTLYDLANYLIAFDFRKSGGALCLVPSAQNILYDAIYLDKSMRYARF